MEEFTENLIDIGGTVFVLDLERYSQILTPKDEQATAIESEAKINYDHEGNIIGSTVTNREYEKGKEVDAPKYDVLRMCIEILLTYGEEIDDDLGLERALADTPISFKVAFNTLVNYGILREVEVEDEE